MPDPGTSLHIQSIDYACTFDRLPAGGGAVSFSCPDPVHFTFSFETGATPVAGQPDVFTVTWDYSWFTQATIEADIAAAMSAIVAAIAELLSLTTAQVDAAVTVRRVWTYAPNVQGPDVSNGRIVTTDYMAYPPQVTSADTVHGSEGASVATS